MKKIILAIALGLPQICGAAQIQNFKAPTSGAQGQFVRVTFRSDAPGAKLSFLGRELPCYENGPEWECLAAIPADAKPGGYELKVIAGDAVASKPFQLKATKFPVEPIVLTQ